MTRRKFIAGAVCPECGVMDRIVVEEAGSDTIRRCVACGFSDSSNFAEGALPKSRLTRSSPATREATPVTKVRIVKSDD